jgi:hypothetical protein
VTIGLLDEISDEDAELILDDLESFGEAGLDDDSDLEASLEEAEA